VTRLRMMPYGRVSVLAPIWWSLHPGKFCICIVGVG
jgi:hypothetical protein